MQNKIALVTVALGLALSGVALSGRAAASCVGYATQQPESGVRACTGIKIDGQNVECIGHEQSRGPEDPYRRECTGIQPSPPL